MKENVPEKVYLHLTTGSHILNGKYYEYRPAKIRCNDKIIEYTRTDAFVEKACVKLKKLMYDNLTFQGRLYREEVEVIDNFVEDFKNYMKEE